MKNVNNILFLRLVYGWFKLLYIRNSIKYEFYINSSLV